MRNCRALVFLLVCMLWTAGCQKRVGTPNGIKVEIEYDETYAPTKTSDDPNPCALTAHFYLDGNGYFYHGKFTYELPEGYEFIGNVLNVGDTFTGSAKNFEGNVDGRIYMHQADSEAAYFSWAEWDTEADGPAPFLKLELKSAE